MQQVKSKEADASVAKKNLQARSIKLADIMPSALNPRKSFDLESLNELADSIKENGLVQPIILRKTPKGSEKKYEIVCGERRYRASIIAGNEDIQAIVKDLDDKQAFSAMIIENLQRKDVDPIEEANALKSLAERGNMKPAEIAKTIGKSSTYVTSHMRLANAIPEFIQLMRDKTIFLSDLLVITLLTVKQQKILYEKRFTPEKLEKYFSEQNLSYGQKHVFQSVFTKWIDSDVMNYLDTARFSLTDESFSCGHNCEGCPLNTKNHEGYDDKRYRCLDPDCFESKTEEFVFRKAKEYKGKIIYKGKGNEKYLEKAKYYGLNVEDYTDRQYVLEPMHPDEKTNSKDVYEQKMRTYNHVKAILDSNIADGTVEHVFELCYNGILSGAEKMAYSIPEDLNDRTVQEVESDKQRISKAKENILLYKEQSEESIVNDEREALGDSPYSKLNTILSANETKVFHALLLKFISYSFKKELGLSWENNEKAFENGADIIEKNRNAIKREFIKTMLSEKSVCYSHDLAGMLKAIMAEQFPDKAKEIVDKNHAMRDKKIDGMKKWIATLKGDDTKAEEAPKKEAKEPKKEPEAKNEQKPEPAKVVDIKGGVMPADKLIEDKSKEAADKPSEEEKK